MAIPEMLGVSAIAKRFPEMPDFFNPLRHIQCLPLDWIPDNIIRRLL